MSVDWNRPFLTEATVEGFEAGGTLISVDTKTCPYAVRNGKFTALGDGWESGSRWLMAGIPDLKFALDTGNLYYAGRGEDIREMMAFAKGRVGHVHLRDQAKHDNRAYVTLGLGAVPNGEIVRTMAAAGYEGWYTLENLVGDTYLDTVRQVAVLKVWLREGCASAASVP